jgi:hypothetical protein
VVFLLLLFLSNLLLLFLLPSHSILGIHSLRLLLRIYIHLWHFLLVLLGLLRLPMILLLSYLLCLAVLVSLLLLSALLSLCVLLLLFVLCMILFSSRSLLLLLCLLGYGFRTNPLIVTAPNITIITIMIIKAIKVIPLSLLLWFCFLFMVGFPFFLSFDFIYFLTYINLGRY